MSQNKIPYFIQYEENASITSTDIIYFDNGTDIAQAIAYNDLTDNVSSTILGNEVIEQLQKLIEVNKYTIKLLSKIASHE